MKDADGGTAATPEADGLDLRIGPVDYALFALTIFPSLFALMFVTSSGVRFLENVRGRRLLMLGLLVLEALLVTLIVLRVRG